MSKLTAEVVRKALKMALRDLLEMHKPARDALELYLSEALSKEANAEVSVKIGVLAEPCDGRLFDVRVSVREETAWSL